MYFVIFILALLSNKVMLGVCIFVGYLCAEKYIGAAKNRAALKEEHVDQIAIMAKAYSTAALIGITVGFAILIMGLDAKSGITSSNFSFFW